MNGVVTNPGQSLRQGVAEGLRGAGLDWLFVARACAAMLVTAWIAMRFNLEQPASAMITVSIVMHPRSGMVLAKSFYRALGTVAGSMVGLLLVSLFPQQRVLFLLAMSLWIGLCAGGSALHRNFKSYGFVLAGYTAAIVAIPVLDAPLHVFDSAVMRVSEVMLGLLVATVFSDVIFPQRLLDVLRQTVRSQFTEFNASVQASLSGVPDRRTLETLHLRVIRDVLQLENLRSSVIFEDAGVRSRSPRLQRLNHAFMVVSTTHQSLHRLMNRLQGEYRRPQREALMALFPPLIEAMRDVHGQASVAAHARALDERLAALQPSLEDDIEAAKHAFAQRDARLDFVTGVELLVRFVAELRSYAAIYVELATRAPLTGSSHRDSVPAFAHQSDRVDAMLVTLRTTLVMLAMGVFWIDTGWSYGAGAMLIATIFSGLLAGSPNPMAAIRNMFLGYVGGIVAAFICTFVVLPRMDGFMLLAMAMLPFLIIGFYVRTRAALVGISAGYVLAFVYMVAAHNSMVFDGAAFINNGISQLIGIGGTAVAFLVFAGVSGSRWLQRRLLHRLRRQVVRACRAPLPDLRERFESASRDLLIQIVNLTESGSPAMSRLLSWGMSVQETGRALIELRLDAVDEPARPGSLTRNALDAVAVLYDAPDGPHYQRARQAVAQAIDVLPPDSHVLVHLHLVRLALLNEHSILAASMRLREHLSAEPGHAA